MYILIYSMQGYSYIMRAVYAAFFCCSLHAVYPATCSPRLARQPEARVCPRAVLTYTSLCVFKRNSSAIQVLTHAYCSREPLRLNSKLLQFITVTKRSAVVEAFTATAKSSAVVEAFVPAARVPRWKKCCLRLQRPAFVSNCLYRLAIVLL